MCRVLSCVCSVALVIVAVAAVVVVVVVASRSLCFSGVSFFFTTHPFSTKIFYFFFKLSFFFNYKTLNYIFN